ncbi:hypothetical protein LCY76_20830 [Fictibacillus sp. KIGAM418]|uniref:Uncharacterized protein n=1 Tax=Fictibacillus marinisediminis TaxID=2878389 RepID=A0A9X1XHE9_9BACL|nr:hypothetical protein [Fictibacillus marinisediminis]MCK6259020.1 hypothetical protein [Fictibacillus marinisediminis]
MQFGNYFYFWLTTCFFLLMSLILPLNFFINTAGMNLTIEVFLAWVIIIFSTTKLCILAYRGIQNLMQLTFWIFVYVWMGITPFLQCLKMKFSWAGYYNEEIIIKAFLIIIVGLISYDLGLYFSKKIPIKNLNESINSIYISNQWIFVVSVISIILSLYLISKSGGLGSLFIARNDTDQLYSSKTQYLLFSNLSKIPLFVCLVMTLGKRRYFSKKNSRIIFY